MKKFISVFLMCSFVLMLFASCMSEEEKEQARKNERLARPMIHRYVEENFEGASVKEIKCQTYTGGSLFPTTNATEFVKAEIIHEGKRFDLAVNIETEEFYTNYNRTKIKEELKALILDEVSVQDPKSVEVKFGQESYMDDIDSGWGIVEDSLDSAEDLLKTEECTILVLFKYVNSKMDFEKISVKPFFKSEYKSEIQISFVNYRNESRYESEVLGDPYIYSLDTLFDDEEAYYKLSDVKYAYQFSYSGGSDGETAEYSNYNEEYKHYKSKLFNDVEFVWNDRCYDIDFSQTDVEPVVATYHDDAKYIAKSSKGIKLDCKVINYEELLLGNGLYMFFNSDVYGYYLITDNNGNVDENKLDKMPSGYVYQFEDLVEDYHQITLGFYEKVEKPTGRYK